MVIKALAFLTNTKFHLFLISIVAIIGLSFVISNLMCGQCNEDLTNCTQELTLCNNQVSGLEDDKITLQSQLGELEAQKRTLELQVGDLTKDLEGTKTTSEQNITALLNRIEELNNDINLLNDSYNQCKEDLEGCNEDLTFYKNLNSSKMYDECNETLNQCFNELETCNKQVNIYELMPFYYIFILFLVWIFITWIKSKDPSEAIYDAIKSPISSFVIGYLTGAYLLAALSIPNQIIGIISPLIGAVSAVLYVYIKSKLD